MATILIIEDEAGLLEEMILMLRFEGYHVLGAANGLDGVELARDHQPDMIISDVMMPQLDGYGVLTALQQEEITRHIPFVFLTAKSDYEQLRRGMELGADDYITKPFTRDELVSAVRMRLKHHDMVAQTYRRKLDDLRESLTLTLPHELRTPLTSLVGYAEFLMLDSAVMDPGQIAETAHMIRVAGERLQRHIENFWLYVQLEMFKSDPAYQLAAIEEQVDHAAALIQPVIKRVADRYQRASDIRIRIADAALIISDESLAKVVEELLDNALKFSLPGTPVHVIGVRAEDVYRLRVSDRGQGMTAAQIKNAGAYAQFERSLLEQQGIGLGLALVREIVALQRGTVDIASKLEQGTRVTITFPLARTGTEN